MEMSKESIIAIAAIVIIVLLIVMYYYKDQVQQYKDQLLSYLPFSLGTKEGLSKADMSVNNLWAPGWPLMKI